MRLKVLKNEGLSIKIIGNITIQLEEKSAI